MFKTTEVSIRSLLQHIKANTYCFYFGRIVWVRIISYHRQHLQAAYQHYVCLQYLSMLSAAPLDIMCLLNYYWCDNTYHNHGLLTAVQGVSKLLDRDLFKATLSHMRKIFIFDVVTIMIDSETIVNTFCGMPCLVVLEDVQNYWGEHSITSATY